MILDHGVKTTQANDRDKRPFLSLTGARSDPEILFTQRNSQDGLQVRVRERSFKGEGQVKVGGE